MFAGEVIDSSVDISTSTYRVKTGWLGSLNTNSKTLFVETRALIYILLLKLRRIDRVGGTDRKAVEWTKSLLEAVRSADWPVPSRSRSRGC